MMDQRNLIVAIALTFAILMGYEYFIVKPQQQRAADAGQTQSAQKQASQNQAAKDKVESTGLGAPQPAAPELAPQDEMLSRVEALGKTQRIKIVSKRLAGSISLKGGRVDDLSLNDYHVTLDKSSPTVTLLSPGGSKKAYYAEFGWSPLVRSGIAVPGPDTIWRPTDTVLSPGRPVSLVWDNGAGLRFIRTYILDENYMFTVTQRVENLGAAPVTLAPYGRLYRGSTPKVRGIYILHEGALGVFDGQLEEVKYKEMRKKQRIEKTSTGGWIGITDKYWLTALIPDQSRRFTGHFNHAVLGGADKYQVDFLLDAQTLPPGATIEVTSRLFAGAKVVALIDTYAKQYQIALFDKAIDWGFFFFLTKPIFYALDFFYRLIGNFGLAILLLTVIIKAIFFPLANKSYRAMSKMKQLQPKMAEIREQYADDKVRQQQETMALYKREKVNPMAGCLPMLIQIPVFFALYKVLFITIEMRHAPFYGWVHDLSAPDPLKLFNLFGLIPWDPPGLLGIGVWPVLMGISMFLQQRLNPQPADQTQARIFMFMPLIFTFILASFPVGLVIYWTWNNLLSMAQQWVIMKRMGVNP